MISHIQHGTIANILATGGLTGSKVSRLPTEGEVLDLAVPRVDGFLGLDHVLGVRGPGTIEVLAVLIVGSVLHHILLGDRLSPFLGILVQL